MEVFSHRTSVWWITEGEPSYLSSMVQTLPAFFYEEDKTGWSSTFGWTSVGFEKPNSISLLEREMELNSICTRRKRMQIEFDCFN